MIFSMRTQDLKVPEGWRVFRLRNLCSYINRGIAPTYSEEPTGTLALGQRCVTASREVDLSHAKFHISSDPRLEAKAMLKSGDVLVNSTGRGTLGRVALYRGSESSVLADGHVTILRSDITVCRSAYLAYVLGSDKFNEFANEVLAVGATNQIELNRDVLGSVALAVPPVDEQQAIVRGLDQERDEFTKFAREQTHLLDLGRERLRSACEWLTLATDSPRWKVKYLTRSLHSGSTPSTSVLRYYEDGNVEWWRPSEVESDYGLEVAPSARKITPEAIQDGACQAVEPGTVLFVGIGATLGKVGVARGPGSCNQQIIAAVPNDEVEVDYLAWTLRASAPFLREIAPATTLPIMSAGLLADQVIPLPDWPAQRRTANYLSAEGSALMDLRDEIERQRALLRERQQGVIVAAVSGRH